MIQRLFAGSRMFITLAVAGTLISAFALLAYGLAAAVWVVIHTIVEAEISVNGAKHLAVDFIELTDLFILGTVLYVVALGLYQLFIDEHVPTPGWLEIGTLDELKERLVSGIIVLMAVSFLGDLVTWTSGRDILYLGIGTAVTIISLGCYIVLAHRKKPGDSTH
jgi:uncharacterized membrane protein YqhA